MKTRIVIPTRNRCRLLEECLERIRQNTRSPYEVVVIDNASSDGSSEIVRSHRARLIVNGQNQEYAAACNQGVRLGEGCDAICFLNDDTEVQPGWLEPLVSILAREVDVAAVGPKLIYPQGLIQSAGMVTYRRADGLDDPADGFYYRNRYKQRPADFPAANRRRDAQCLTGACLLVRRCAFEQAGGFDEAYRMGHEDVDLCFKLVTSGWRLVYQPQSTVIHHEGVLNGRRARERVIHERKNMLRCKQRWSGVIPAEFETLAEAEPE